MRNRKGFTWVEWLIAIVIIAIVIPALIGAFNELTAQRRCLAKGYSSAKVAFPATIYCIKRVDQTDVVARLDTLR